MKNQNLPEVESSEDKALPKFTVEEKPYVHKLSTASTKVDREKFWESYNQALLDRIFEIKQANIS